MNAVALPTVPEPLRGAIDLIRAFLQRYFAARGGRAATDGPRAAVSPTEVARFLARVDTAEEAVAQAVALDRDCAAAWAALRGRQGPAEPLATLGSTLGLSDLELQLVLALAMGELDAEVERMYVTAWDDFTRKRPDVGFLTTLVGGVDAGRRDQILRAFGPEQPLRRHRIVLLAGDGPLMLRQVRLADRVIAHLLGHDGVDESIAAICRPSPSSTPHLVADPALIERLRRALRFDDTRPPRVLLYGPDGIGKATLIEAVSSAGGRRGVRADLEAIANDRDRVTDRLAACGREAALRGAVLIFEVSAELATARIPHPLAERIGELLTGLPVPVALAAAARPAWLAPYVPELVELEMAMPSYRQRIELWRHALPAESAAPADIEVVAGRYAFGGGAIARAAHRAAASAWLRDPAKLRISLDDLGEAARLMFSHRLGDVAQRIPAGFTWDDLVLPQDTIEQIREVVRFARERPFLLEEWGFARKLPYGRGVSAILAGPPGTGKTMVAQLLARELGYDLFRIDLSQVVNKYIGETEKNLARIFAEAESSHAVLFFDEADALFAKRTDVRSSNDRYANLEVNYLLQRMETYDGVTLLATNLEQGLDEAFKRRVRFTVQFDLPDVEERDRLWRSMFPPEAPLDPEIDWHVLATTFEMAGGYIKKAAIRAALAAADARPRRAITTDDLLRAARSEYREMGRIVSG